MLTNTGRNAQYIALAAVSLLLAALAGCGGGKSIAGGQGATRSFSTLVDFGNRQTGTLNVTGNGPTATGKLVVNAPPQRKAPGRGFDQEITAGSYDLTGTAAETNTFNVSGTFPSRGGGAFTVTGTFPTPTQSGTYTLTSNGQTATGGIPIPGAPAAGITVTPAKANVNPGEVAGFEAIVTQKPNGKIVYRWFIAAPAAYLVEEIGAHRTGTDIETDSAKIEVQTAAADYGKLTLHVHAFNVDVNGVRTFLGEGSATVELPDIRVLPVNLVTESNPNRFGTQTIALFWEFPDVPGAKDYVITIKGRDGATFAVYRMFQRDVDSTPVTDVPILTGNDPFPQDIPVREELTGVVRMHFVHRASGIRMLLVWGGGFDPNVYAGNYQTSVVVSF